MLFLKYVWYHSKVNFKLDLKLTLFLIPKRSLFLVSKKIEVFSKPLEFLKISEESFSYKPLESLNVNILLDGYFQSYKYFKTYQSEIRDLFSFKLESKYDPKEKVSVHIRRGNYTQLSQHHHNLSISYYLNAIEQFPHHNFLIFSDDIKWYWMIDCIDLLLVGLNCC